jgi:hypothetical protein
MYIYKTLGRNLSPSSTIHVSSLSSTTTMKGSALLSVVLWCVFQQSWAQVVVVSDDQAFEDERRRRIIAGAIVCMCPTASLP